MAIANHPNIRIPPPLLVVGLLAAGLAMDGRLWPIRSNGTAYVAIGTALACAGIGLGAMALRRFFRAGTAPEPWRPSSALVTVGIYRFTRNPMYLGMLLLAIGVAVSMGSIWTVLAVAVLWLALTFLVVLREEAYLQRRFGAAYDSYRAKVRRWI